MYVRMEQGDFHQRIFVKFRISDFNQNVCVDTFRFVLLSDKSNGHFYVKF
jgi:hypothetical protein